MRAIVHTEHSLPGSRKRFTRVANRLTYPLCNIVISVSEDVRKGVEKGRWLRPKATRLINGGVDFSALQRAATAGRGDLHKMFDIPSHHMIVGNVAHLREQKGHDVFLETARLIVDVKPDTTFILVGREKEAGFKAKLVVQANRLNVADRVRFAGFRPDPYPIVEGLDVFLMTSRYEGFPIALVEAMGLGRASVATDVGGIREAVVDGETGLLAPPRDASALAAAVLRLLGDEAMRNHMGASAKARVQREFSISRTVARIEATYEDVLGTPEEHDA